MPITKINSLGITNPVSFSAGTAALPSITFSGDTNTGVFAPAADTIGFAEGGTEVMRINSAGEFLVGRTTAMSSPISGNKYIGAGNTTIESSGSDVTVTTSTVIFSKAYLGAFAVVRGFNTSGGAQFVATIIFTLNASITVTNVINNTGLTLTFTSTSGQLRMSTSSGTVSVNYTIIGE